MATMTIDPAYPNLLQAIGSDLLNADGTLNRAGIRTNYFSAANPLGNLSGRVDFIICFLAQGVGSGNWSTFDHSLTPRPLRGIISMSDSLLGLMPNDYARILGGGLAHEVGHYWLVPGNGRVRTTEGEVETPTTQDIWTSLNQGLTMPPYPVLARQDSHWSPYIDGQHSPMDSVNHVQNAAVSGSASVTASAASAGLSVPIPGVGNVTVNHKYSPLELWIMGDLPATTDPDTARWNLIEPRWVYPLPLQAGLYLELTDNSAWYVGFNRGPVELKAERTDGTMASAAIPIAYPFEDDIGVRALQLGSTVIVQARTWRPRQAQGCLGQLFPWIRRSISCNMIWSDVNFAGANVGTPVSAPDMASGWHTLVQFPGQISQIGLSSRCTNQDSRIYSLLSGRLCRANATGISEISVFDLTEDIPKDGPRRLTNGSLMMPYADAANRPSYNYQETPLVHEAPKLTASPPGAPFGIGALIKLNACAMVNWIGGGAHGRTMVGTPRHPPLSNFIVPWTGTNRSVRQSAPLNGEYKFLFSLVAGGAGVIQPGMLTTLDALRRAWESYFPLITSTRQASTSGF